MNYKNKEIELFQSILIRQNIKNIWNLSKEIKKEKEMRKSVGRIFMKFFFVSSTFNLIISSIYYVIIATLLVILNYLSLGNSGVIQSSNGTDVGFFNAIGVYVLFFFFGMIILFLVINILYELLRFIKILFFRKNINFIK